MEELERHNPYRLVEYLPQDLDLTPDLIAKLKLEPLVEGYGTSDNPRDIIEREYGVNSDPTKRIYFALGPDGTARGSFVTYDWVEGNERGDRFWGTLRKSDPKLASAAQSVSPIAMLLGGIVVLPADRKDGIAKQLLRNAIDDRNPAFALGGTKTPEALVVSVTSLNGYKIFFGNHRITPDLDSVKSDKAIPLVSAFLAALGKPTMIFPSGAVDPRAPDVSRFPVGIKNAFADVISAHQQQNPPIAMMKPMIAVNSRII
jgi:hypothetical protein